jgi:DNA-binding transcriptional MerR regulator
MITISALAEQLGVTPAIIRSWQINLNLPLPAVNGSEQSFDEQWQQVFSRVAQLRKQGQSFSQIRQTLAGTLPPLPDTAARPFVPPAATTTHVVKPSVSEQELGMYGPQVPVPTASQTAHPLAPAPATPPSPVPDKSPVATGSQALQKLTPESRELLLRQELKKVSNSYVRMVENYQALASRYSESTYTIGQLEEKNRALEERLRQIEQAHQQQAGQMLAHIDTLKHQTEVQEERLDHHSEELVTHAHLQEVEKQIKLLTVTLFRQQQTPTPTSFWERMRARLFPQA